MKEHCYTREKKNRIRTRRALHEALYKEEKEKGGFINECYNGSFPIPRERKYVSEEFYINSEEFYNFIFKNCYEYCNSTGVIKLPKNIDENIKNYLLNFFLNNNLGFYDINEYHYRDYIKLYKEISFEDIVDAYYTEIMKINNICSEFIQEESKIVEEYAKSLEFYNFIFNTCYEASENNRKVYFNQSKSEKINSYLKYFFLQYKLSYTTLEYGIIKDNLTFEDIRNAYALELQKYNLTIEDIENKSNNLSLIKKEG